MTQIQTALNPNIVNGPRGIGARSIGGAYTQDCQQDIVDCDSLQGTMIFLTGTTDAINPHVAGNYIVDTGGVDAITLAAPTAELDDGLQINIWSDTTNAHTVTCPSALFEPGATVAKTIATFAAFKGAGLTLRAVDGFWHVLAQSGITFT